MVNSLPMPASSAPAAVIDALNALLEAEQNSIFRFMGEGSPYLSRASADVRRPLGEMVRAGQRRAMELAEAIDRLGGVPSPRGVQMEEQYLAFLTLKFLLPKLAEATKLAIERYENTLRALKNIAPNEVIDLLNSHVAEHNRQLDILENAKV
jgi:hypothetical protein